MRVMRAADKIKTRVFHQLHIAKEPAIRHGIPPPCVILMNVGAFKITMLSIQEKSLVGGELKPAKTQRRRVIINSFFALTQNGFNGIEVRSFWRPKAGMRKGDAGLIENIGGIGGDGLGGFH